MRYRISEMIQPDSEFVRYGCDRLNRLDTVKDGNPLLADYDYNASRDLFQNSKTF
jgi:hypothetical protein